MSRSTGRRLRARPIRPRWRSSRSCSCWTGSKPFSRRIRSASSSQPGRRRVRGRSGHGEEVIDHRPEDAEQLVRVGAVVGEVVDVGLARAGRARRSRRRSSAGPGACSSAGASSPEPPVSSSATGALRVDPEVVDDRLHRERQGVVELGLDLPHDRGDLVLELVVPVRERRRRPCRRPTCRRASGSPRSRRPEPAAPRG